MTNRRIEFEGYGERRDRGWYEFFGDALVAASVSYDGADLPDRAQSWGIGGRAGLEGGHGHGAAWGYRLEGGLNPAHGGIYVAVSFGLDLNLSVGGGLSPEGADSGGRGDGSGMCTNTCRTARDGECDDGGPGAIYGICAYGTDCADCGAR